MIAIIFKLFVCLYLFNFTKLLYNDLNSLCSLLKKYFIIKCDISYTQ